jgi:hypothetical protein
LLQPNPTANCTFNACLANTAGKSFILFLKTGSGGYTGTFTGVKRAGQYCSDDYYREQQHGYFDVYS